MQPDRAQGAGLAFGQIPSALSELCLAVNQRESQIYKYKSSNNLQATETEFYYTGDGTSGAKKSRPLVSDWPTYAIHSQDRKSTRLNSSH